ncbi:cytochrome c biogenesis protein ResB, partial [Bacillus vallismortis]|nr:cytochrome c biogenesis protein ResB [Bacillus vallismortis]
YTIEGKIGYCEKQKMKKVTEEYIRVNQPLRFDSISVYQVDYKENQLDQMVYQLIDKKTKKSFGRLTINHLDPDSVYDLG